MCVRGIARRVAFLSVGMTFALCGVVGAGNSLVAHATVSQNIQGCTANAANNRCTALNNYNLPAFSSLDGGFTAHGNGRFCITVQTGANWVRANALPPGVGVQTVCDNMDRVGTGTGRIVVTTGGVAQNVTILCSVTIPNLGTETLGCASFTQWTEP